MRKGGGSGAEGRRKRREKKREACPLGDLRLQPLNGEAQRVDKGKGWGEERGKQRRVS